MAATKKDPRMTSTGPATAVGPRADTYPDSSFTARGKSASRANGAPGSIQ